MTPSTTSSIAPRGNIGKWAVNPLLIPFDSGFPTHTHIYIFIYLFVYLFTYLNIYIYIIYIIIIYYIYIYYYNIHIIYINIIIIVIIFIVIIIIIIIMIIIIIIIIIYLYSPPLSPPPSRLNSKPNRSQVLVKCPKLKDSRFIRGLRAWGISFINSAPLA